ncbi:MAG: hypothetical protein ABI216_16425 [Devosia sp.]
MLQWKNAQEPEPSGCAKLVRAPEVAGATNTPSEASIARWEDDGGRELIGQQLRSIGALVFPIALQQHLSTELRGAEYAARWGSHGL